MKKIKRLTVGILCLRSLFNLKDQLNHIKSLLNDLPKNYKHRIDVFVSDNNSKDGTEDFLKKFSKEHKWLKYFIHPENVIFDSNVLTTYTTCKTEYVWFLAVDEQIASSEILKDVLDIIDKFNPVGINCMTSSEKEKIPHSIKNTCIKVFSDPTTKIQNLKNGGKLSANIIKIKDIPKRSELNRFIGFGYMHLSLHARLIIKHPSDQFVRVNQPLIFTKASYGSRNNYHPKLACFVEEALAFKKLVTVHPKNFKVIKQPGLRECKFIINQARNRALYSWHSDMINEFIHNTFFTLTHQKITSKTFFLSLIALISLLPTPNFFFIAFKGLIAKQKINLAPQERFRS